jgi:NAD(P)-dependent dehydrogenase (short-subunit alcohol dehydrogenase family)
MRGLRDKVVLVTGGANGIGAATCRRLAEEGARVAVTDADEAAATRVAEGIRGADEDRAAAWHLDVADEAAVAGVIDQVVHRFGRLDAVVSNAGISGANKPPHEIEAEEWRAVMRVNVEGVFFVTKHAVPRLREAGGGAIVNLSSIYGIVGAEDIPPYHASKGAVREMTKVDALFYAKDGIRVNSVHPGFVWTPLVEELAERSGDVAGFRAELDARHPVGRVGRPEEIAAGIAFLVSDDAAFMTGAELTLDGGYTAR